MAHQPSACAGRRTGDQHDRGDLADQPQEQRGVQVAGRVVEDLQQRLDAGAGPRRDSSSARARENDEMAASAAENRPARTTRTAADDEQPDAVHRRVTARRVTGRATRRAAAPAARTSPCAPRARRGRSRAGAGCRGRSAARSRPRSSGRPSAACRAATSGQSTRSPSMPSSGSSLTSPGRSSSIGKASTSVGPSFSIHCSLSSAMVSSSTALMHSSACGCTRIRSITKRLRRDSRWTSSVVPGLVEHLDASRAVGPRWRVGRSGLVALVARVVARRTPPRSGRRAGAGRRRGW